VPILANNRIQVKRTTVPGRVPNTTNSSNTSYIAPGEFALNMTDKQLYTSDGTNLITIGSAGASLTLSESLRIGDIASDLLSINSTSVFTGNLYTNTTINTTSISVQNSTSNSVLSPTTIYVGNTAANIAIDVTGGIKSISISLANISTTGVATIQTSIDHGITSISQSKLIVNTAQVSLNTANYSVDYQNGFNIIGVPTPNTITFTVPTDNFKYKWGDRTIQSITRDTTGLVTVATRGPHLYQNLDQAYVTNVNYKKVPFSLLDYNNTPAAVTLTVLDSLTVAYMQSQYATVPVSLVGATLFIYNDPNFYYNSNKIEIGNVYFEITAPSVSFSGYTTGSSITFTGIPNYTPITSSVAGIRLNPNVLNGTWTINSISDNGNGNSTIVIIYTTRTIGSPPYSLYNGLSLITLTSGSIIIDYTESGTVGNLSQLCPVLANTSIVGNIYAANPVGVTIKNGTKVVYVFDSGVYVGNTTVGNIIDVSGSRTFNPSSVG